MLRRADPPSRRCLVSPVAALALAMAVSCGSGSNPEVAPSTTTSTLIVTATTATSTTTTSLPERPGSVDEALASYGDCLEVNDAAEAARRTDCAAEAQLAWAMEDAAAIQAGFTGDQIEQQNFLHLATQDCLEERGIASASPERADGAGNLVDYRAAVGDVVSLEASSVPALIECRDRSHRMRSATCGAIGDPNAFAVVRYRIDFADDGWLMSEFAVDPSIQGEWRFSDWSVNTNTLVGSDATGQFDLELATPRALLRTPDGTCALALGPSDAEGFQRVALVGDSNTAAVAIDLAGPNELPVDARSWVVSGESGGTWFASADIVSSGPLDELQGALATNPQVVVVALGINDALVWGVGSGTPAGEAVEALTVDAIGDVLGRLEATPCVVLVTPPAEATTALDAGESYAVAALRLNASLAEAADTGPNVHLADWAAESAAHHATADPWFVPDEIHLTQLGRAEFVRFIRGAIDESCAAG